LGKTSISWQEYAKAHDYRTSWYHSHYSSQYGDGIVGPIVIAGPATSNYDIDLGAMTITDWCKNNIHSGSDAVEIESKGC
jgi:hypothetical protein